MSTDTIVRHTRDVTYMRVPAAFGVEITERVVVGDDWEVISETTYSLVSLRGTATVLHAIKGPRGWTDAMAISAPERFVTEPVFELSDFLKVVKAWCNATDFARDNREGRLHERQQDLALEMVAEWLGKYMGLDGPAPTGERASDRAAGPNLNREWDWPSAGPTPTILLEGAGGEWAYGASMDPELVARLDKINVFAEPYAGWALCLYVLNKEV